MTGNGDSLSLLFEGDRAARDTVRFIEEKLGAGIWTWDLAQDRIAWSPGIYRLFGLDPAAVQPYPDMIESMIHPEDRRRRGELLELVREGLPFDRDFRVIRPDGTLCWVANRGVTLFDEQGKARKAIGVMQDVTRAQEARKAAKSYEEYFFTLAKASGALVWSANSRGEVTGMPGFRNVRSDREDQFLGGNWQNMIHPDDREQAVDAWLTAVMMGEKYFQEKRVLQSDGSYRWMRARCLPIRNSDGTVREFLGAAIDIEREKVPAPAAYRNGHDLTGAQIRGARAILNWSVRELAEAAGISIATIRRLEEMDGAHPSDRDVLTKIEAVLSEAGAQFTFPFDGKPAVAPR